MRIDDHTRRPLDVAAVRNAVVRPGGLWRAVEVTDVTGSTNADLLARAPEASEAEGLVLAAEEQRSGRGRMQRTWVSPPRAGLTFSLLVRPAGVPSARRGWLSLLTGVAVADAVRAVAGVPARLKWPNDVLAGEAKLGGILAEAAASADAVVIGIGINVSTGAAELPPLRHGALAATSLAAQGWERADREELLIAILACFERWYRAWSEAAGDPDSCGLRAGYVQACATLGRRVTVQMPGDQLSGGLAVGIDSDGRLLVRVSSGSEVPVAAGDVVHVR